jgi:polysaccharide pyruvyl transferase CsaB
MNILLCTASLEYGGAETHVCELASGLVALGHRVTVASPGGALAASLSGEVKHIRLPRFSRRLRDLIRSSRAIRKLLRRGGFNIVHAHARRPAYICRKYTKKYGCGFVVTAHALFKMTPALRRLSAWGERTIAVSEDIKQLLVEECGVYPGHITVIPNGIDTRRFAPRGAAAPLARRILFVSRMDPDCSLTAQLLCRIAGRLSGEFPDVKITLVGGGSEYERIRALAEGVNTVLGRAVVEAVGARGDIERLLSEADVFVGVSRAALEAASAGLPVILCGNEGYAGILSEDNIPAHSNFCGRGCPLPDAETLHRDLRRILLMSPEERQELGNFGREYVIAHNSSDLTARSVAGVYEAVLYNRQKNRKIGRAQRVAVICGYYGFGNAGDNAILDSMLTGLQKYSPQVRPVVLSANTKVCAKRFGVRCVSRTNPLAVFCALRRASYFILGGGTLLQDATSPRSLRYYLTVSRLALFFGCRLVIAGSGLGPLYGGRSRLRVAALLRRAVFVGLREPTAHDMLRSLKVSPRRASVYADLGILTLPASEERVNFLLTKYAEKGSAGGKDRYVGISLRRVFSRHPRRPDPAYFRLASALDEICDTCRALPLFFVLAPEDRKFTMEIIARMKNPGVIFPCLTPSEITGILSRCLVAVGMRLHMLVFALAAGLPAAGIACDPKIGAFLDYAGLPPPVPAGLPAPGELVSLAAGLAEAREEYAPRLAVRYKELAGLADAEIRAIAEIFNGY